MSNLTQSRRNILKAAVALAAFPLGSEAKAAFLFKQSAPKLKPSIVCPARVLVPAYFWDAVQWDKIIATTKPCDIIFNPSSGPYGENYQLSTGWSRVWFDPKLAAVTQRGHSVFGYVATGYGKRALADILAEVDAYIQYWGVSNFFFDEVAGTPEAFAMYQTLYAQVKSKAANAVIILNAGVLSDSLVLYFGLGSSVRIVTYENTQKQWSSRYRPSWHKSYMNRSYALVHTCSSSNATQVLGECATEGYLGAYCTARTMTQDPWSALASYWATESTCPSK